MAYHERRDLLAQTLNSYERFYPDAEISICDDRSVPMLVLPETSLDVTFSRIEGPPGAKNPCVPLNQAVNQSRFDVIVLTNPEVEHTEDVLTPMLQQLGPNTYVTAGCVEPSGKRLVPRERRYPVPNNSGLHFCTMLTRELWERVGGFDEHYRDGQAMDDVDFLYELEAAGATFRYLDKDVTHHPTGSRWHGSLQRNTDYFRQKWNLS